MYFSYSSYCFKVIGCSGYFFSSASSIVMLSIPISILPTKLMNLIRSRSSRKVISHSQRWNALPQTCISHASFRNLTLNPASSNRNIKVRSTPISPYSGGSWLSLYVIIRLLFYSVDVTLERLDDTGRLVELVSETLIQFIVFLLQSFVLPHYAVERDEEDDVCYEEAGDDEN